MSILNKDLFTHSVHTGSLSSCRTTCSFVSAKMENFNALVAKVNCLDQRTLTIVGSMSVRLTSCLTGLDLTKQVKVFIQNKQSS